ncbi:hypothetical protein [Salinarimonas soli]|uniref:DUF3617 family protein n=1 Tax=Salinarimonas soli TaxID=1638099 RepID=A0A5B2V9K3_9HYPH|nr:hypothetical protein [Salinarimonas soli]KAA2236183.1 hypothetical protein F0L46_15850 [Salinarimonas soli]
MVVHARIAILAGCLAAAPVKADEMLAVYGAWVMGGAECGTVFANDRGRIVFAQPDKPGAAAGFIVDRGSVSNNDAICKVREFTVRDNVVSFNGRCALGRRTKRQAFTMRELNGRFQVKVGGEFIDMNRCAIGDLRDLAAIVAEREQRARENVPPLQRVKGLWATRPEVCATAFRRDAKGEVAIAGPVGEPDMAIMVGEERIATPGSDCVAQQVLRNPKGGRDFQATYLCTAEGREFATTETISAIDGEVIERVPSARNPVPQRLVRCEEPAPAAPRRQGAVRP